MQQTAGSPYGLFERFSLAGCSNAGLPIVILNGSDSASNLIASGIDLLKALDTLGTGLDLTISQIEWDDAGRDELAALHRKFALGLQAVAWLAGGHDGLLPATQDCATACKHFEALQDISIVAAPGSTWQTATRPDDVAAINDLLIAHAEMMRYRIAVLDAHEGMTIADVRHHRARLDSTCAALHCPWVAVLYPVTRQPLNLPPCGLVAGIDARNDSERAVYKAPANEVVRGAIASSR